MPESIPQACPECGANMGRLVCLDGEQIFLDVGNFLVVAGRKTCHVCGHSYHFRRPKKPWKTLLQQYQQLVASGVGG